MDKHDSPVFSYTAVMGQYCYSVFLSTFHKTSLQGLEVGAGVGVDMDSVWSLVWSLVWEERRGEESVLARW